LDAANNEIEDIQDIEMCTSLIKLNFKNNKIKNLENLDYFYCLSNLKCVNFNDNPIQKEDHYSSIIKEKLSEVETIDKDDPFEINVDTSTILGNTMVDFHKNIDLGNLGKLLINIIIYFYYNF